MSLAPVPVPVPVLAPDLLTLRIAGLPALFRPSTSHVYPPFKKGRYMEEYLYEFFVAHAHEIQTGWIYLPVFWTHLQNHPAFPVQKGKYQLLLDRAISCYPAGSRFFTCVQHDDGPGLTLPPGTVVYGACSGDVPLPLLYEDTTERLYSVPRLLFPEKVILASFVGTLGTHPVREAMHRALEGRDGIVLHSRGAWSVSVAEEDVNRFVEVTSRSSFCLAPRGYGRSSFRFFEAMRLDVIPVYIWDDVEWLPYKGEIEYERFSVSVHVSELDSLYDRLAGIQEKEYQEMVEEMRRVRGRFELEGMSQALARWITSD
jgi:Exostosin family